MERDKKIANERSITTAQLTTAVYSFLGAKKVDLDSFLPYPANPPKVISEKTARTLQKVIKTGKLPAKAINLLSLEIYNQLEAVWI